MKKWIVLVGLALSTSVFATPELTPEQTLESRLNEHQTFSANFTQKVTSPDGELLLDAKGNAKILRPSLFRWETKSPDENLLVSDGKNVWYYDPFMSQVTIMTQENAMAQTPFVLLTRNQSSDWDKYQVTQQNDTFTLVETAGQKSTFTITIDDDGVVKSFKVVEQDGQVNEFTFSNVEYYNLGESQFTFNVPQGVEVDDQR